MLVSHRFRKLRPASSKRRSRRARHTTRERVSRVHEIRAAIEAGVYDVERGLNAIVDELIAVLARPRQECTPLVVRRPQARRWRPARQKSA